ncbi:MAG: hypothetical protein PWQ79_991 [Thermococcaceae archaeon]|nr:hypothetical protein [Thermococcaceae archaeon]MDK2914076.1 hypothetical protein [Thermococcaceae archaeon]
MVRAVYMGGVLKPLEEVPLQEGAEVEVIVKELPRREVADEWELLETWGE